MSKTQWTMDALHSEIQFKVKHLMITNITGQFKKFEGTMETTFDDYTTAKVHITVDINSIDTNNEQRDAHLKTGDFFDAVSYPHLTFVSDKMEKADEENYKLHGILTIRGVSKKIVLDAEFGGIAKDGNGNTRAGFFVTGKINRKDFGVSFGRLMETGGAGLGEEVKFHASVQFVKQVGL